MTAYQEHGADIPRRLRPHDARPVRPHHGRRQSGRVAEARDAQRRTVGSRRPVDSSGRRLPENAEYRYISPAFYTDDEGRMSRLINVALTNLPRRTDSIRSWRQTKDPGLRGKNTRHRRVCSLRSGSRKHHWGRRCRGPRSCQRRPLRSTRTS